MNKRSNNGIQHICALTKDEITAPHANLVPLELPGDLYSYIAEHVWVHLEDVMKKTPKAAKDEADSVIDQLITLKKQMMESDPKSEERRFRQEAVYAFKSEHADELKKAAPVFWSRITDRKHRRKIAKR